MFKVGADGLAESSPKVILVLLNWNGWKDTLECLESIFHLDYSNYQVIVCDNDSSDESLEHICAWADGYRHAECSNPHLASLSTPPVRKPISYTRLTRIEAESHKAKSKLAGLTLIQTGGNLGFAAGNNIGLRFALNDGCDFVWLLNNDTVIRPDSLNHLISKSLASKEECMCGSTVFYYHAPDTVQVLAGASYNSKTGVSTPIEENKLIPLSDLARVVSAEEVENKLECLIGASMFVPRSFLIKVGLLAEEYFLYSEENDWAERGTRMGYKIAYAPLSVVYHKLGSSTKSTLSARSRSFTSDYHQTRSRLIFTQKFYPAQLTWVRLTLILGGVKRLLWGKPKHALMQWKMAIKPYIREKL